MARKTSKTAKSARKAKTTRKGKGASAEADTPISKTIVPVKYKAIYKEHGGTCGDKLATALTAAVKHHIEGQSRPVLNLDALYKVAKENGIDPAPYKAQNPGQQRMNIGNRVRALLVENGSVKVAGKTVRA